MSLYKNDKLEYLKESIKSILSQKYSQFDFYIQFDGVISQENINYLNSIDDVRIKIYKRDENKGLAASLNDLLKIVLPIGYKYIARMDADDIAVKTKFSKQVKFFEENIDIDILGTNALLINKNSRIIGEKKVKKNISFRDMLKRCELIHPSVMFRSSFFKKVGLYDEQLKKSQDYELWLRALKQGIKIANINENLIMFRYEPAVVKRRKNEQKYNIRIKKKYLTGLPLLFAILPNFLIEIIPTIVLELLLRIKYKDL